MSISSSIFQKTCPACASNAPVSAERCQCGHTFESAAQQQSPQELALRDEELYEGYLNARAEQAEQTAYIAAQAQAEAPKDPDLIAAAELAREVAHSIEADLEAQRRKIAALRAALPVVIKPVVAPTPVLAPIAAPAPIKTAPPLPLPDAPIILEVAAPIKPTPATVSYAPPALNPKLHRASAAQKAAGVLAALKSAKAKEAAARAQQALSVEQKLKAQMAAQPVRHEATASNSPSPSFLQEQAAKAEKVMEARKLVDAKECSNCTASVPLNTSRCHCGFTFSSGNTDLPSLTLCTGDFTALRNSLKLNLRKNL